MKTRSNKMKRRSKQMKGHKQTIRGGMEPMLTGIIVLGSLLFAGVAVSNFLGKSSDSSDHRSERRRGGEEEYSYS